MSALASVVLATRPSDVPAGAPLTLVLPVGAVIIASLVLAYLVRRQERARRDAK